MFEGRASLAILLARLTTAAAAAIFLVPLWEQKMFYFCANESELIQKRIVGTDRPACRPDTPGRGGRGRTVNTLQKKCRGKLGAVHAVSLSRLGSRRVTGPVRPGSHRVTGPGPAQAAAAVPVRCQWPGLVSALMFKREIRSKTATRNLKYRALLVL